MTVGERIRSARKAKGLTQKYLAILSGTSEITVRQYEIGKRQPRIEQLCLIADALGVSAGELLGEDKSPYDESEEIFRILANIFCESSNIFDDYYVWHDDSKFPEKDRVELSFPDISAVVLEANRAAEKVKRDFLKNVLHQKFFSR